MKQKIRRTIVFCSLLLFPVTLNYMSPYVSLDGAMAGVVSGSILLFFFLFVSGLFFGRAWCAWVCPMAGLSQFASLINAGNVNVKKLKRIRYSIFTVWAGLMVLMFVLAGGIKGVDPLRLTESGVSVDEPFKYIVYYAVLAIFAVFTLVLGKRGACHAVCWMSPFLTAGYHVGKMLKTPRLRIVSGSRKCAGCGVCVGKCPMSIDVRSAVKDGYIKTSDCILCGECVDGCAVKVLHYGIKRK